MFDAVDNHVFFINKNNITVFSHDFDNHFFTAGITKFI